MVIYIILENESQIRLSFNYLFVLVRFVRCLNSSLRVAERVMSLNMPSNFDVNCAPHSVRSLRIILFSDSSDSDFKNFSYFTLYLKKLTQKRTDRLIKRLPFVSIVAWLSGFCSNARKCLFRSGICS